MKFPRCALLMIALVLYISILHIEVLAVEPDEPTQKLVDSICMETEDYEFCNNIIQKHLKTPSSNLKGLAYLILITAIEQASDTYIFIGSILRERPGPEETASLTTCLLAYNIETTIFLKIRHEFSIGDYEGLFKNMSSTMDILNGCKTGFPVHDSTVNPLIEKNREMRIVITMANVSCFMTKNGKPSLLSLMVDNSTSLLQF